MKPDAVLKHLKKLAADLPRAETRDSGDHCAFLVSKKIFAYFLNNHHGDGIVAVAVKVLPGDNQRLAAAGPEQYCLPAYIASRGWVSYRLDRGAIDWDQAWELLAGSYCLVAPKKLAADVQARLLAADE